MVFFLTSFSAKLVSTNVLVRETSTLFQGEAILREMFLFNFSVFFILKQHDLQPVWLQAKLILYVLLIPGLYF